MNIKTNTNTKLYIKKGRCGTGISYRVQQHMGAGYSGCKRMVDPILII